jgi:hypothetical protein
MYVYMYMYVLNLKHMSKVNTGHENFICRGLRSKKLRVDFHSARVFRFIFFYRVEKLHLVYSVNLLS